MTALERLFGYAHGPSVVGDHGSACCRTTRSWFAAMDRSRSFAKGVWRPPAWLSATFPWGPLAWPVFWCELPTRDRLDCGALAAVATHLFTVRGEQAVQAEVILRFSEPVTDGWAATWIRAGQSGDWAQGGFCYHEVTAVINSSGVRFWDPADNRWLDPETRPRAPFGGVVAVRLAGDTTLSVDPILWGARAISTQGWTVLHDPACTT